MQFLFEMKALRRTISGGKVCTSAVKPPRKLCRFDSCPAHQLDSVYSIDRVPRSVVARPPDPHCS
jgi:hypothetical protein